GCYYMTDVEPSAQGAYQPAENGTREHGVYSSFGEARLAFDLGHLALRAAIRVRTNRAVQQDGQLLNEEHGPFMLETTVGRMIFNELLPEDLPYQNEIMDRPNLRRVVAFCYRSLGDAATAEIVDKIKNTGFHYATRSGVTIAI